MKYEALWRRLTSIYDTDEAKAIVRWVLDARFGLSLVDIVCGKVNELTETEQSELEGIMRRLEKAEPVQYVLEMAEFCGRRFHVEPGVLIPRPETGDLCRMVSQRDDSFMTSTTSQKNRPSARSVLDVGTGSGCIAITLALEMPEAKVTAWDVSEEALCIAKKNAQTLGADVTFEKHDALDSSLFTLHSSLPLWDVIVSNPPYVCQREATTMEKHVLEHEPHLALFVPDDDPLCFYRAIAQYACKALMPSGLLYFELNPLYAHETEAMIREMGFVEMEIRQDMFGKQRFLKAKKT